MILVVLFAASDCQLRSSSSCESSKSSDFGGTKVSSDCFVEKDRWVRRQEPVAAVQSKNSGEARSAWVPDTGFPIRQRAFEKLLELGQDTTGRCFDRSGIANSCFELRAASKKSVRLSQ